MDLMLDRPVAVKLLRETGLRAETLARFRAEARLAGKLSDPHIAQVHDYAEAAPPDPPYLVMELVGSSLAAALAEGPLPVACVLDVLAQASLGLHAAHQAGLVHRDVKPANILLGPGGLVKIADFGIACPSGSVPRRGDGTVTGTPAYLAPELFSGAAAGPASDLYALGIVAYECLAGAPPFTGLAHDVTWAHLNRPLPPLPREVPKQVAALIGELVLKDPAARPASAGLALGFRWRRALRWGRLSPREWRDRGQLLRRLSGLL